MAVHRMERWYLVGDADGSEVCRKAPSCAGVMGKGVPGRQLGGMVNGGEEGTRVGVGAESCCRQVMGWHPGGGEAMGQAVQRRQGKWKVTAWGCLCSPARC